MVRVIAALTAWTGVAWALIFAALTGKAPWWAPALHLIASVAAFIGYANPIDPDE